jgi:glycerophosphoryl diester phosphodiesterase
MSLTSLSTSFGEMKADPNLLNQDLLRDLPVRNTNIKDDDGRSLRRILGLSPVPESTTSSRPRPQQLPRVVGHRGALYDSLENTRDGFLKCAYDIKCDAVELDVFLLPKCGTLVVFHGSGDDVTPGELTGYILGEDKNTPRSIMDLSYEEVLKLQFNPAYEEFACPEHCVTDPLLAYIPSLEQVLLDLQDTNCKVKIELKGPGVVQPVLDLVERLGMQKQCSYSSFKLEMLHELRALRPDRELYPTGALFDGVPPPNFIDLALDAGATEVHLKYDMCTTETIARIHDAGLVSMAWLRGPIGMKEDSSVKYLDIGNEDEACYQALIETGVQQICCNKPSLLQSMLATTILEEAAAA